MAEWQRLTDQYREMSDEELQELSLDFGDLTETAQRVLRNEMSNRGLGEVRVPQQNSSNPIREIIAGSEITGDSVFGGSQSSRREETAEQDGPHEYSWKTELCECETTEQARLIQAMLRRAGIDSWVRNADAGWSTSYPRVVVGADQLEEAIQIAQQPIPQEIIEDTKNEVPEFVLPRCPKCGAEDPVLEAVEPTNSWACEACGAEWAEPAEA